MLSALYMYMYDIYIACRVRMCQYTVATYVSLTKERRVKQTKKEIYYAIIVFMTIFP